MTQLEFEQKYHRQFIKYAGGYWAIPEDIYYVTAALYQFDSDNTTILGIVDSAGNWLGLHVAPQQFSNIDKYFNVVSDEELKTYENYEVLRIYKEQMDKTLKMVGEKTKGLK
jgi:hypothetical protein